MTVLRGLYVFLSNTNGDLAGALHRHDGNTVILLQPDTDATDTFPTIFDVGIYRSYPVVASSALLLISSTGDLSVVADTISITEGDNGFIFS